MPGQASDSLNHRVDGPTPEQRALLLIHPLGADMSFWDDCVAVWRDRIACIACDLRSAGFSPRSAGPVTIARHVADLEALRSHLGVASVVPIGCAVGSMIAAAYAAAHGPKVPALVLANPALKTTPVAREMLSERARLVTNSGMQAILPDALDKPFRNQPADERRSRYYERFARQDPAAYSASILGILDADASTDLRAVACPALVVAGGNDVLLPPDQARLVRDLLHRSRLVQFDDAAHFIPFQKPEAFAQLVLDFLNVS